LSNEKIIVFFSNTEETTGLRLDIGIIQNPEKTNFSFIEI